MTQVGEAQLAFAELVRIETDECVLWPYGVNHRGYGKLKIKQINYTVHALSCTFHHGPRPEGFHAAHCRPDGTPCVSRSCLNGRHLAWKSAKENAADTYLHGTRVRGTAAGRLTEDEVRAIRASSDSHQVLAARFQIARSHVWAICNRRIWAWLPDTDDIAS